MSTHTFEEDRPPKPGRLVIQYLQDSERGATATEILQYLRSTLDNDVSDLKQIVETVLVNGMALGFLERKGSHYMNWLARDMSGRRRWRRRRRCCSKRRRAHRHRSCRRRRRHKPRC